MTCERTVKVDRRKTDTLLTSPSILANVTIDTHLNAGFERETDDHESDDGVDVVLERGPVVDPEGSHESSHQHEEDGARAENRARHQERLERQIQVQIQILFV